MDKLFLGIKSHVVCLSKTDGAELWRTKLKSSAITNVYYDDGKLYAYSGGHCFCLNPATGSILWENPLKGLGYSTCIIASENQSASVISGQVAAQQTAAASVVASSGAASAGSN